ncbi:MAG: hypothetical protein ABIA67_04000 [Candidatus Margulisiibacteriota bacterium]
MEGGVSEISVNCAIVSAYFGRDNVCAEKSGLPDGRGYHGSSTEITTKVCAPPALNPQEALEIARSLISKNNDIRQVLSIESQVFCQEDVIAAYRVLAGFIQKVKGQLREGISSKEKLKVVYDLLDKEFDMSVGRGDGFLISNLKRGVLDCDTSSLVVLAIAQELGWTESIQFVYQSPPDGETNHVFVRMDDAIDGDTLSKGYVTDRRIFPNRAIYGRQEQRVLEGDKIIAMVYDTRAAMKYNYLKDDPGAVRDASKAISLDPQNPTYYLSRGQFRMKIGDISGAVQDFERTLVLNPHDAIAKEKLNSITKKSPIEKAWQSFEKNRKRPTFWGI